MTDKVQKIRNEVEKLKSNLMYGACSSQVAMETRCKEEAYNEVLSIMDSMQEKPKQCMYSKDNYTAEDRKVLCDGCEEECEFNKKEEPVSEDLEEAAIQFATDTKTGKVDVVKQSSFLWGAIYHKQQMEAYRIEHCKSLTNEQAELEDTFVSSHVEKNNRIPTFIDAIEYGMEYCKQQMMAKAIRGHVGQTINGMLRALSDEIFGDMGFTAGDKVKLIILKED